MPVSARRKADSQSQKALIAKNDHAELARRYLLVRKRWRILKDVVEPGKTYVRDRYAKILDHQKKCREELRDIENRLHDLLEKYVQRRFTAIVSRAALEEAMKTAKGPSCLLTRAPSGTVLLNGKPFYSGPGDGAGAVQVRREDLADLVSRRGDVLIIDAQRDHWVGWFSWTEIDELKTGEPLLFAYHGQKPPRI